MDDMNTADKNIDALLDQVAEALTEGNNELASQLLPEILESGDEVQCLMAESYLMQIEALQALEQEELPPEEAFLPIGSDEPAEDDDMQSSEDEMLAVESKPLTTIETTEEPVETEHQDTLTVASEEPSEHTSSDDSTSEIVAHEATEQPSLIDVEETPAVEITNEAEAETDAEPPVEDQMALDDITVAHTQEEEEINTALTQAEMLINDEEFETAVLVLQTVLENGDEASRSKAKAMILKIDFATSLKTETVEISVNNSESDSTSVIDSIFDEGYQGFSEQQTSAIPSADAEAKADVFAIENQLNDDREHETYAEAFDTPFANGDVDTILEQTADEIEKTIVTEVFPDDEDTSGLLSPTQALQASDSEISSAINSTSRIATSAADIQRQGFHLGDAAVMIDFADGSELTEMPEYFKVPNAPSWLVGVTNLHGVVIPIFDLHNYLNLGQPQDSKPMLLVLQHGEKAIGVIIHGLPRRISYSKSQRMETNTAPKSLRAHIHGAYLINENLWFDLNSLSLAEDLERSFG